MEEGHQEPKPDQQQQQQRDGDESSDNEEQQQEQQQKAQVKPQMQVITGSYDGDFDMNPDLEVRF